MKFSFWTTSTYSYIEADFDEDDSFSGSREEDIRTEMIYRIRFLNLTM